MVIKPTGTEADHLLAAETARAQQAQVHITETGTDGVSTANPRAKTLTPARAAPEAAR